MSTTTSASPRRFSPWVAKQRPVGDWVVDQFDRVSGTTRRFGPYKDAATARALAADLNGESLDATIGMIEDAEGWAAGLNGEGGQ